MYEDYYDEPYEQRELKHSGFGISSFVITLAMGALAFVVLVIAGIIGQTVPGGVEEDSPIVMLIGLAMIGCLLVDLLGTIFGVVGLFQQRRKKVFAVLGVLIGGLVLVGLLFIIVLGLVMG